MLGFPVRRLAEVFATFAPMTETDALRRAETALETLRATRDRSDLLELGLALHALDAVPLNALGGAGVTAWRSATHPERERILLAWGTSRIPRRRTAYQALKRLALFLAYADPGPDPGSPSNAMWDRIGYRPAPPVPGPAAPAVAPLDLDRAPGDPLRLEADLVVIGSGAGGGVVASRAAAAGRSVVVLEAGGHWPEPELPRLEAEAWRDLYLERGAASTTDLAFTVLAGATVGGGTTINWTTCIAPGEAVRAEWADAHGLHDLAGAPFDAALARVEAELDLREPSVIPRKERLILDGAAALGWDAAPTRRNAGPCTDCGACGFGCPLGAKRSGIRVHLAAAQAAGARLVDRARVTRLLRSGDRVVGVVARLAPNGRRLEVRAPQVVAAAGALRTPVVLDASGVGHPDVGRHLRLHPTAVIAAQLPDPVETWIGPLQAARSLEFARPGPAAADGIGPAHGGFLIESAPAHPGLAAAALPWTGRGDGQDFLSRLRFLAPLLGLARDRGEGRVRPAGRGRARVEYRLGAGDGATLRRAFVEMARLAIAGGATELLSVGTPGERWTADSDPDAFLQRLARHSVAPNRIGLFSAHQMGTARAGRDPRSAPCDPWGRVRLDGRGTILRGAYVADGSLFPTAAGVNPMLTIMALADLVAGTVIADGP
jgi:choline dehydrogenase-like flavoprotein